MIDGLKLTFTGDELRRRLQNRIERHRAQAERLEADFRGDGEPDEDAVQLPEHMLEEMLEEHEWRAKVLEFIQAHIEEGETYRLGRDDLEFGELLPPIPGIVEAARDEARGGPLAFEMGRLTRAIDGVHHGIFKMSLVDAEDTADVPDAP
jgi:hypothetical protein